MLSVRDLFHDTSMFVLPVIAVLSVFCFPFLLQLCACSAGTHICTAWIGLSCWYLFSCSLNLFSFSAHLLCLNCSRTLEDYPLFLKVQWKQGLESFIAGCVIQLKKSVLPKFASEGLLVSPRQQEVHNFKMEADLVLP